MIKTGQSKYVGGTIGFGGALPQDKAKARIYQATYREANREKLKARHKEYRKRMKFRLSAKKKFGSLANLMKLIEVAKTLKLNDFKEPYATQGS